MGRKNTSTQTTAKLTTLINEMSEADRKGWEKKTKNEALRHFKPLFPAGTQITANASRSS